MKAFPLTLAAIKKADQNQWAIGDALLAECGPPSQNGVNDGSFVHLIEVAGYLLVEGYEYSTTTLSAYRVTAQSFRPSARRANIPWAAHKVAGTPEFLDAVIAGAPEGTSITYRYVENIRQRQADHARKEREEQAEVARAAREKAEAEEALARKKVHEAQEAEEKKAAEAEVKKAERQVEKARAKEEEVKVAPKKKDGPPTKEQVPLMVAEAQFLAQAARSTKLALVATKDIETCLEQLSDVGIRALTEAALEAANAWSEAAWMVRSEVIEQRGHLSVVEQEQIWTRNC
jgi:hypothetical protein